MIKIDKWKDTIILPESRISKLRSLKNNQWKLTLYSQGNIEAIFEAIFHQT